MTRLRSRRRRRRHCCCWWITAQATAKPDAINGHFPRCSIKWLHTHRWEDYSNSLKFYIASGYTFGFRSVTLRPFNRKMSRFCLPGSRCRSERAPLTCTLTHAGLDRQTTAGSCSPHTTFICTRLLIPPPCGEMLFHQLLTLSALSGQLSASA